MTLTTSERQLDGVTIVDLKGRIVFGEEAKFLREKLKELSSQGRKKILLNMAEVTFVDSSGLGALVSGSTAVASQQGQLKLANIDKDTFRLMQMAKLFSVLEAHGDEASAIKSFQ
jgi:anti-sigma B factor antagonist